MVKVTLMNILIGIHSNILIGIPINDAVVVIIIVNGISKMTGIFLLFL